MSSRRSLGLILISSSLAASCITSASNQDVVRQRFAAEHDCNSVSVKEIEFRINRAGGTYVATGCGVKEMFLCDMGTCAKKSHAKSQ